MHPFDSSTGGQAFAAPGMDTRQWCSFGTVDLDTPDARSVVFTTEYGPLVRVTLHPSATPVMCRVAHEVAGNGEGEWFPFVAGDEVIVLIPEGDESAGCTIVGRLNQEIDAWPQQVAGMDTTLNNLAFRRLRTPYVLETASNYLVRSAATGAFFGIKDGAVTFGNSDNALFSLSPDFLGLQSGDATTLMQIDVSAQQVVMEANGTKLVLDAASSSLYTSGMLALGTSGQQASEHATSIESVLALFYALGAALTVIGAVPLTGASLGAVLSSAAFPAILAAAATFPLDPVTRAALVTALQVPKVPGSVPGVAAAGLTI